jgi:hypothetical protein
LTLSLGRLGHGIGAVEQEDRDLFVGLLADIHRSVYALAWLLPVNLSRRDLNSQAFTAVAILNREATAWLRRERVADGTIVAP